MRSYTAVQLSKAVQLNRYLTRKTNALMQRSSVLTVYYSYHLVEVDGGDETVVR